MEHLDKLMRLLENESVDYKEVSRALCCDCLTERCVLLQLDEIKDSVEYYIESYDVCSWHVCVPPLTLCCRILISTTTTKSMKE